MPLVSSQYDMQYIKKGICLPLLLVEKQMPFRVIVLYKLVCHCIVLIIDR